MNVLNTVKKTISTYGMIKENDKILIALSGGPDSVCLLSILKELASGYKIKLYIAHLNHGLRGKEADRDQEFCEALSRELTIPFFQKKVEITKGKVSLEDKARKIRYQFLEDIAHEMGAVKVALGHNADDQAETVLMRFLRGAGAQGLAGIAPVRALGKLFVIRPLIDVWRKEILNYLKQKGIVYHEDSSNKKLLFFRNRIRHKLLPVLSQYNLNIKSVLKNTGANLALTNEYLKRETKKQFKRLVAVFPTEACLDIRKFQEVSQIVKQELIRMVLANLAPQLALASRQLNNILLLTANGLKGSKRIHLAQKVTVLREYNNLIFFKEKSINNIYSYKLSVPGELVITGHNIMMCSMLCEYSDRLLLAKNKKKNCFEVMLDYDKIFLPLSVRNRRPGDIFQPPGLKGRKKVQDIFVDAKVPERYRDLIPLVVSGNDNEICWIAGYRVGEKFKITSQTKKIVKITTEGVNKLWPR